MKLKKPKFWDYQHPNLLSYFLLPLTLPIIINNLLLSLKKHTKKIKPKKFTKQIKKIFFLPSHEGFLEGKKINFFHNGNYKIYKRCIYKVCVP